MMDDDDDDDEYHQGTHIILHVVLLYLYVFRSSSGRHRMNSKCLCQASHNIYNLISVKIFFMYEYILIVSRSCTYFIECADDVR